MTPAPAAVPERTALLDRLGFVLNLGFLLATLSCITDVGLGRMHLPAVLGAAVLVTGLVTRRLFRGLREPVGKALVGLTALMALSVPFSVWRGGSYEALIGWMKSLAVYFMITGFVLSLEQLRTTAKVIAISVLILAIMSLVNGSSAAGRLGLESVKFGNPNDLAQVLLMAVPMWWLLASSRSTSGIAKIFAFALSAPMLVAFLRTGSRAGLVGFVAMLSYSCVSGGAKRAMAVGLGGVLLAGVVFLTLPSQLRQRFFVLFGQPEEESVADQAGIDIYGGATGSAAQRWMLLKDSMTLTFRHPLLGVGLGQFQTAQRELAASRGDLPAWRLTHNSFTQVSSENGIPALLLYLWSITETVRILRRARRQAAGPHGDEIANAALFLMLSLIGFLASAMFASVAYGMQLPMLAGMAAALSLLTRHEAPRPVAGPVHAYRKSVPPTSRTTAASAGRLQR